MSHAIALRELVPFQLKVNVTLDVRRWPRLAGLLLVVVPGVVAPPIARHIIFAARKQASLAVWLRGARLELAEDSDEGLVDPSGSVLQSVDECAAAVQRLRELILEMKDQAKKNPRFNRADLVHAGKLVLATSAELFEELQAFKSELLEHDADRAPRLEGMTASTPEELQKLFARL